MYSKIVEVVSKQSYCSRLKVGCIAVKDDRIISLGYNGTPSGDVNVCENADGKTLPTVIHAESNMITKLASSVESGKDSLVFITHAPCIDCAKLLYQTKVEAVCYIKDYKNMEGVEFLREHGVKCNRMDKGWLKDDEWKMMQ